MYLRFKLQWAQLTLLLCASFHCAALKGDRWYISRTWSRLPCLPSPPHNYVIQTRFSKSRTHKIRASKYFSIFFFTCNSNTFTCLTFFGCWPFPGTQEHSQSQCCVLLGDWYTNLPKIYGPPQNYRHQNGDINRAPCRGSTNIRRHRTKCSHQGDLAS